MAGNAEELALKLKSLDELVQKYDVSMAHAMLYSLEKADFMVDNTKVNIPLANAVSHQIVAAAYLFVTSYKRIKPYDHLSRAVTLRALLEVTANINYMVSSEDSVELAKKFLLTSDVAVNSLQRMKKRQKPERHKSWTPVSIGKRIRMLENKNNEPYLYSNIYAYLSSYAHSDAGHMGIAHRTDADDFMDTVLDGFARMLVSDIYMSLMAAGLLSQKDIANLLNEIYELAKKKESKASSTPNS